MTSYDNAGLPPATNYDAPIQHQGSGVFDRGFVTSLKGILKAAEIAISLILVITSSEWERKCCSEVGTDGGNTGGGWVLFVSTTALLCTSILYVLYVVNVAEKIRGAFAIFNLGELVYNGFIELCYFISAIIAAVFGAKHPAIGASAFFCFAALVPFGIDTFFSFQTYRTSSPLPQAFPSQQQTPRNDDPIASVDKGPQY